MKLSHHLAVNFHKIRAKKRERRRSSKKSKTPKHIGTYFCVTCPNILSVTHGKYRNRLLKFLQKTRDKLKKDNIVNINFSSLSKIEAQAGLLLWAELSRLKDLFPSSRMRAIPPRLPKSHQVLTQIGITDLCSMRKSTPKDHDVIYWRAASSTTVDGELYSRNLIDPIEQRLPEDLQGTMWTAVQEAMDNIPAHAYIKIRNDGLNFTYEKKRWWMFSHIKDNYLSILIIDLGVGIPTTISEQAKEHLKPHLRGIKKWLGIALRKDSDVLSAVMKKTEEGYQNDDTSLSRTGENYRGRGLYDIMQLITHVDDSAVSIMSNKGYWIKNSGQETARSHEFDSSILGTLISWRVPLCQPKEKIAQ